MRPIEPMKCPTSHVQPQDKGFRKKRPDKLSIPQPPYTKDLISRIEASCCGISHTCKSNSARKIRPTISPLEKFLTLYEAKKWLPGTRTDLQSSIQQLPRDIIQFDIVLPVNRSLRAHLQINVNGSTIKIMDGKNSLKIDLSKHKNGIVIGKKPKNTWSTQAQFWIDHPFISTKHLQFTWDEKLQSVCYQDLSENGSLMVADLLCRENSETILHYQTTLIAYYTDNFSAILKEFMKDLELNDRSTLIIGKQMLHNCGDIPYQWGINMARIFSDRNDLEELFYNEFQQAAVKLDNELTRIGIPKEIDLSYYISRDF